MDTGFVPAPRQPSPGPAAAPSASHREGKAGQMAVATFDNPATTTVVGPDDDAALQHAISAAIDDPRRIDELLDQLSRDRLWLPLPEDGQPVTDGSAVNLPTVIYLGREFVPAFTSADRLLRSVTWTLDTPLRPEQQQLRLAAVPHVVVPVAALARLLPAAVGIAVNPGEDESVPVYPDGVAYLAAARPANSTGRSASSTARPAEATGWPAEDTGWPAEDTGWPAEGTAWPAEAAVCPANGAARRLRVGPPAAEPTALIEAIRAGLRQVPAATQAATAWLSVEHAGEGLVISVTLDDPAEIAAQDAVLAVVEWAARTAAAEVRYPIDVTFPGEGEPDVIDRWVSASARPFYRRRMLVT